MINTNVLLLLRSGGLPAQLREHLVTEGFASQVVSTIEELQTCCKKLEGCLILIDSGATEDGAVKSVRELISVKDELKNHPILLVGKYADAFEETLETHFEAITTVETPCAVHDIVAALVFLQRSVSRRVLDVAAEQRQKTRSDAVQQTLLDKIESIPKLLFKRLESINSRAESFDVSLYSSSLDLEYFESRNVYPASFEVRNIIREICRDAGKWGRLHLCRVAFIANEIAKLLPMQASVREQLVPAAFLYAWSFCDSEPEFLKQTYHLGDQELFRKNYCSRVKDSAMKVSVELGNPIAANIISAMAKAIGRENSSSDDDISIAASLLMAADMIDRACFQNVHWSSRAAYFVLRRIKAGQLSDIHPAVLCCIVKFLSDRIAASSNLYLLHHRVRTNATLIERAKKLREEPVAENELKVPLEKLLPGMRLSRPIYAFDGREVLEREVRLDEDLIWRIWQLQAIRPLNAPVITLIDEE
ncbi:MAG: hypothetical protein D6719_08775 [Candidatus Dadabacteria bacterium]|nr:MAG: hypothetical protein D6719_08775 [Candidatus Dadabacteria bacterium]